MDFLVTDSTGQQVTLTGPLTIAEAEPTPPDPTPVSSTSLLEDFASLRLNGDHDPVWSPYLGENSNQVGTWTPGQYAVQVTKVPANSSGLYFQFIPRSGGYPWPSAYAQTFTKQGVFDTLTNRLSFWFKPSVPYQRRADGSDIIQIGTYIRQHNYQDIAWQGQHYYHLLDPNLYPGQWHLIVLNRVPQHLVGGDSNKNWPDDPEWVNPTGGAPVHYFDGLTRWYFSFGRGGPTGTFTFAKLMTFDTVVGEPDELVSSICAVYAVDHYEVSWAGPKNTVQKYDVAWVSGDMSTWPASSVTVGNPGTAYTGCIWQSPKMPQQSLLTVSVRPQGQASFTQVQIPMR